MGLLTDLGVLVLIVIVSALGVAVLLGGYYLGRKGEDEAQKRWDRLSPEKLEQFRKRYERWGAWLLLLAIIPYVGPPLSVAAGVVGIRIWTFVVMTFIAKFVQTALVVVALDGVLSVMGIG
jgi:membrane protein YqaA with SNARE-associated domain